MAQVERPNWCFVEDNDTSAAIIALMRHHMPGRWPAEGQCAPVLMQVETEMPKLLKLHALKAELQASGRRATGIVVDADENLARIWTKIQPFVTANFIDPPHDLPESGLVVIDPDGRRFGLWVMPDNRSTGMLEDFLRTLIPDSAGNLWAYAAECVAEAKANRGAECRDVHITKARLHTFLAWQDPPGERLGIAVTKKFLDPEAVTAIPFIAWFKRLFEL